VLRMSLCASCFSESGYVDAQKPKIITRLDIGGEQFTGFAKRLLKVSETRDRGLSESRVPGEM